jgi:hypothetical protein
MPSMLSTDIWKPRPMETLNNPGPAVVWIRLPDTRRPELLARFDTVLPDVFAALERRWTLIEVI